MSRAGGPPSSRPTLAACQLRPCGVGWRRAFSSAATALDALPAGQARTDSFAYAVADQGGLSDTATLTLTESTINDVRTITGTARNDALTGDARDELILGLASNDRLTRNGGADTFVIARQAGDLGVGGIGDFRPEDVVQITGFAGVDDFSDLRISQRGSMAVVSFAGGAVGFSGLTAPLVADDFIFG